MIDQSFSTHRAAATAATREKILRAAFQTLSRKGYENTTIKDIAEEAGVAQGLLHYHFKSKQRVVLAVLAMCCAEMDLPDGGDPVRSALEAFEHFKAMLRSRRDVHSLYVQLIGVGLHDSEVGDGILEFVRQNRGAVEAITSEVLGQAGLSHQRVTALAAVVWGATLGIMIQSLLDPEFDADSAVDALAAMSMTAVTHAEDLA